MRKLSDLEKIALADLARRMLSYEKEVQKVLAEALKEIRGEMSKIYDKYAVNGILTRVEMSKYNKYITMEKQLLRTLSPSITKTIKSIDRLLPEQYEAAFFEYAWAMDNGNNLRIAWGIQNEDNLRALFSMTNPKNLEFRNALKNYDMNAKLYLRNALLRGLAMGKSYTSMIKDIRGALNKSYAEALRILRTEGQRALNKGQDDLYNNALESGIQGRIIWDATLDARTRPSHAAMDGVAKSADGLFYGLSVPTPRPMWEGLPAEESINCRCSERFEVDGFSPIVRRTREEGVLPYQTFIPYAREYHPDWLERKGFTQWQ
jgi:SPP1 gp7 family putative phage head morphogenesis protein